VSIGARISASTDISEVSLTLNGAAVQPKVTEQSPQIWLIAYTGKLDAGKHEVRLTAKDRDGRAGGYRWQFDVESQPAARPSPEPRRPNRT
jgi:hypothetical protein